MKNIFKFVGFFFVVFIISLFTSIVGTLAAFDIQQEILQEEILIQELLDGENLSDVELTDEINNTEINNVLVDVSSNYESYVSAAEEYIEENDMPNLKDLAKEEALSNLSQLEKVFRKEADDFINSCLQKYGVPQEPIVLDEDFLIDWMYSRIPQINETLDWLGYSEEMKLDYFEAYQKRIVEQGFEMSILVLQSQGYNLEEIKSIIFEENIIDEEFSQALMLDILDISVEAQKFVIHKHLS